MADYCYLGELRFMALLFFFNIIIFVLFWPNFGGLGFCPAPPRLPLSSFSSFPFPEYEMSKFALRFSEHKADVRISIRQLELEHRHHLGFDFAIPLSSNAAVGGCCGIRMLRLFF